MNKDYLNEQYVVKQRSTYAIAEECHTYANNIRRLLKKFKIPLRNKSNAQSIALSTGRHKHPTKGVPRSSRTKTKISEGVANAWENFSKEQRQDKSDAGKQRWAAMSDEEKKDFHKLAAEAIRETSISGSKLEKYLLIELQLQKYNVEFHKSNLLSNEGLQVDLYLPELKTVIEVDGPTHFLPIWSDKSLARHVKSDNIKTGLLLAGGYVLLRIKNMSKNLSQIQQRNVLEKVLSVLKDIKNEFPKEAHRLIEVEVI